MGRILNLWSKQKFRKGFPGALGLQIGASHVKPCFKSRQRTSPSCIGNQSKYDIPSLLRLEWCGPPYGLSLAQPSVRSALVEVPHALPSAGHSFAPRPPAWSASPKFLLEDPRCQPQPQTTEHSSPLVPPLRFTSLPLPDERDTLILVILHSKKIGSFSTPPSGPLLAHDRPYLAH